MHLHPPRRVREGSERKAQVSSGHIALPARTGDDARSVLPAGKVTRAVAPDLRGAFLTQARSTEPSIAHTANLHLQHPPRRWPEGPLRITSLAQTTGCGPKGPPEMATTLCPSRNEKALKVTSQELGSEADLPLGQNTHHVVAGGKGSQLTKVLATRGPRCGGGGLPFSSLRRLLAGQASDWHETDSQDKVTKLSRMCTYGVP